MINLLQKLFIWIYSNLNIRVELNSVKKEYENRRNSLNLNVGSGSYHINGFVSLDVVTAHYKKRQNKHFKHYDIRSDMMPYEDGSVKNIYVSHVLEHIEKEYTKIFFSEAYRVLKKGGVLRICVPDGKFLFNASKINNSNYWIWRGSTDNDTDSLFQNYIQEVITNLSGLSINDPKKFNVMKNMQYDELRRYLISLDIEFDYNNPGNHIQFYDEDVLRKYGLEAGLSNFIVSKQNGSLSEQMTGADMDLKHPKMSLYGEFIK
tara:strand:- start:2404 stop:3189 length:786 start_codon:yes stop_codon:yes gene_type:complete